MSPAMLSVVIPVHAETDLVMVNIQRLAHCGAPLQIVVVENGSQELTPNRLRTFGGGHELRLLQLPDADLSAARNAGLEAATGRYVMFLDADDIADVRVPLDIIEGASEPIDVIHVAMQRLVDPDLPASRHSSVRSSVRSIPRRSDRRSHRFMKGAEFLFRELVMARYSPVTGAYLFRREWLVGLGLRFTPRHLHEDHAFVVKALAATATVVASNQVAFFKRERRGSIMQTMRLEDSIIGYERAVKDLRVPVDAMDRHLWARVAVIAVAVRLDHVLARKELRLLLRTSRRTRVVRGAARVMVASVRLLGVYSLVAVMLLWRQSFGRRWTLTEDAGHLLELRR